MVKKTRVKRMLVTYLLVTFCDLTLNLIFFKSDLCTHAMTFLDLMPALWVSLSCLLPVQPTGELRR